MGTDKSRNGGFFSLPDTLVDNFECTVQVRCRILDLLIHTGRLYTPKYNIRINIFRRCLACVRVFIRLYFYFFFFYYPPDESDHKSKTDTRDSIYDEEHFSPGREWERKYISGRASKNVNRFRTFDCLYIICLRDETQTKHRVESKLIFFPLVCKNRSQLPSVGGWYDFAKKNSNVNFEMILLYWFKINFLFFFLHCT